LEANREKLTAIAMLLLEKEIISSDDINRIVKGEPPAPKAPVAAPDTSAAPSAPVVPPLTNPQPAQA
jgi:hypothetical protein